MAIDFPSILQTSPEEGDAKPEKPSYQTWILSGRYPRNLFAETEIITQQVELLNIFVLNILDNLVNTASGVNANLFMDSVQVSEELKKVLDRMYEEEQAFAVEEGIAGNESINMGQTALIGAPGNGKSTILANLRSHFNSSNRGPLIFPEKGYQDFTLSCGDIEVGVEASGNITASQAGETLFNFQVTDPEIINERFVNLLVYTYTVINREAQTLIMMRNLMNIYGAESKSMLHQMGIWQVLGFIYASACQKQIPPCVVEKTAQMFGLPQHLVIVSVDPQEKQRRMEELRVAIDKGKADQDQLDKREHFFEVEIYFNQIVNNLQLQLTAMGGGAVKASKFDTGESSYDKHFSEFCRIVRDNQDYTGINRSLGLATKLYLENPGVNPRLRKFKIICQFINYLHMLIVADNSYAASTVNLFYDEDEETFLKGMDTAISYFIEKLLDRLSSEESINFIAEVKRSQTRGEMLHKLKQNLQRILQISSGDKILTAGERLLLGKLLDLGNVEEFQPNIITNCLNTTDHMHSLYKKIDLSAALSRINPIDLVYKNNRVGETIKQAKSQFIVDFVGFVEANGGTDFTKDQVKQGLGMVMQVVDRLKPSDMKEVNIAFLTAGTAIAQYIDQTETPELYRKLAKFRSQLSIISRHAQCFTNGSRNQPLDDLIELIVSYIQQKGSDSSWSQQNYDSLAYATVLWQKLVNTYELSELVR